MHTENVAKNLKGNVNLPLTKFDGLSEAATGSWGLFLQRQVSLSVSCNEATAVFLTCEIIEIVLWKFYAKHFFFLEQRLHCLCCWKLVFQFAITCKQAANK